MGSVCRQNTQQSFFLHYRQSQCLQFHFRSSGLKIMSSDSRTLKYEFSFEDLKKWVRFSGLKFWGRDLEKFQGKSEKKFKVIKLSKIVPKCPNVFWGVFFDKKIVQCSMGGRVSANFQKKNSKSQKSPKSFPKVSTRVLNMLCGDFSEFFLPSVPCRVLHFFWTYKCEFSFLDSKIRV